MCLPAGRSYQRHQKLFTLHLPQLPASCILLHLHAAVASTLVVDALESLVSQSDARKPDDTLSHAATYILARLCTHRSHVACHTCARRWHTTGLITGPLLMCSCQRLSIHIILRFSRTRRRGSSDHTATHTQPNTSSATPDSGLAVVCCCQIRDSSSFRHHAERSGTAK
jgi:hypothetical protein